MCFYFIFFLSAIAQVVEGGGEMDITFQVISPSGALVVDDQKKTDDLHTVQADEKGVYAFCFDNSFSTLAEKTVYADLGLESDDIDNWLSELEGDKSIEDQQLQVESLRVLLINIRVYFTQKNVPFKTMHSEAMLYCQISCKTGNYSLKMFQSFHVCTKHLANSEHEIHLNI